MVVIRKKYGVVMPQAAWTGDGSGKRSESQDRHCLISEQAVSCCPISEQIVPLSLILPSVGRWRQTIKSSGLSAACEAAKILFAKRPT